LEGYNEKRIYKLESKHGLGKCFPASALDPLFEAFKDWMTNQDWEGAGKVQKEIEKLEKLRAKEKG
jgi:hypothetical protein